MIDENKIRPEIMTWIRTREQIMGLTIEEVIEAMVLFINNKKERGQQFKLHYSSI